MFQVVVGDQRGDLDDDVSLDVQPGHLEIHPYQHVSDPIRWPGDRRESGSLAVVGWAHGEVGPRRLDSGPTRSPSGRVAGTPPGR